VGRQKGLENIPPSTCITQKRCKWWCQRGRKGRVRVGGMGEEVLSGKLLLALASTIIFGSESCRTHDHIYCLMTPGVVPHWPWRSTVIYLTLVAKNIIALIAWVTNEWWIGKAMEISNLCPISRYYAGNDLAGDSRPHTASVTNNCRLSL
jgi:hypothetical protein